MTEAYIVDAVGTPRGIGLQSGDIGRMAALDTGYDVKVGGVTLNRFCSSSITSTSLAAATIMSGMSDLMVPGNPGLLARHPQSNQGVRADAIAAMEGLTPAGLEQFGVESQRRAAKAIAAGRFAHSTIVVKDDGGMAPAIIIERI
ncbi:MAG: hypothetical protein P8Y48_14660 [Novosphingobium sp.]